ncbi:Cysteine proteinase inhibitor 3 [Striga hermonthica]|uniref:Cysteine proteinase inhibitor n=1 Tax=Striga hermonthica TaxID=68872 RepID=A0A9N7RGI2_STRHE|nr:Cysteine proteinase inhibitor 3 [Striga hermonthica]
MEDNLVFNYSEYMDDLNNSEGFYVTPSRDGSVLLGGIRPVGDFSGEDRIRRKAEAAARYAVEEHNNCENGNRRLDFLKILNLNVEPAAGALYYITLAAADESSGEVSRYEAKVWEKINTGYKVQIFRLAPYSIKSSDKVGNGICCVGVDNLMPWMNETYLYYKCFYRIRRQLLGLEVIKQDIEKGSCKGVLWLKNCEDSEEILKRYDGKNMPCTNQLLYDFDMRNLS